jgi:hypothetical protein
MKEWNGRTVFVEADSGGDSEKNPSNSAGQFIDARRRHNLVTRLNTAREQGLLSEAGQFSKKDVEAAASEMLAQLKMGRLTRQHIEMEQKQDMDRLAGWKVVAPAEGTDLRARMEAVQYRMTVRAAALEAFTKQELTALTSTTGHHRDVTDPMTLKPWRPGVAPGDMRY